MKSGDSAGGNQANQGTPHTYLITAAVELIGVHPVRAWERETGCRVLQHEDTVSTRDSWKAAQLPLSFPTKVVVSLYSFSFTHFSHCPPGRGAWRLTARRRGESWPPGLVNCPPGGGVEVDCKEKGESWPPGGGVEVNCKEKGESWPSGGGVEVNCKETGESWPGGGVEANCKEKGESWPRGGAEGACAFVSAFKQVLTFNGWNIYYGVKIFFDALGKRWCLTRNGDDMWKRLKIHRSGALVKRDSELAEPIILYELILWVWKLKNCWEIWPFSSKWFEEKVLEEHPFWDGSGLVWCEPDENSFFWIIHSAKRPFCYSSFYSIHPGGKL